MPTCFVAYASSIPGHGDAIEAAVAELKGGGTAIKTWVELEIDGQVILSSICSEIINAELFVADVTQLNSNVLFELGFAIAKKKKVCLLYDLSLKVPVADFNFFQLLTTTGYSSYTNSREIATHIYRYFASFADHTPLFEQLIRAEAHVPERPPLLYLKPDITTEAVLNIARAISTGPLPSLIDDPAEISSRPLSWYVEQVSSSFGVVCHFLSDDHTNAKLNHAKNSLVAGIAMGLEKPTLILAHQPCISPIDFRDKLQRHETANQARSLFDAWLQPYLESYEQKARESANSRLRVAARRELSEIRLGDPVAEFEAEALMDYFVETPAYLEVMKSKFSIFVGRKGAGKTAMLLKVAEDVRADPRNHVCLIRPLDYELEGLAAMLKQEISEHEKGYLVESFWKLLIYTEFAKSVYERILSRPGYYVRTSSEEALCAFVQANETIILPEFSSRLEAAILGLGRLHIEAPSARKGRISEQLHTSMLQNLRLLLGEALNDSHRVAILIDNLDKSWTVNEELPTTSKLLAGILNVGSRIAEEFQRSAQRLTRLDLVMAIFIRSDILQALAHGIRERDKLPLRTIMWDDPQLLARVVAERLAKSGARTEDPDNVWVEYFEAEVAGIPTRDFITSSVFPRPRDLLVLMKASLQRALNRGAVKIGASDILAGLQEYSAFAYSALETELEPRYPEFEELMKTLLGENSILNEGQIAAILQIVSPAAALADVVNLLCESMFLGYETEDQQFDYLSPSSDTMKIKAKADKFGHARGGMRYRVHPIFARYLEMPDNAAA